MNMNLKDRLEIWTLKAKTTGRTLLRAAGLALVAFGAVMMFGPLINDGAILSHFSAVQPYYPVEDISILPDVATVAVGAIVVWFL